MKWMWSSSDHLKRMLSSYRDHLRHYCDLRIFSLPVDFNVVPQRFLSLAQEMYEVSTWSQMLLLKFINKSKIGPNESLVLFQQDIIWGDIFGMFSETLERHMWAYWCLFWKWMFIWPHEETLRLCSCLTCDWIQSRKWQWCLKHIQDKLSDFDFFVANVFFFFFNPKYFCKYYRSYSVKDYMWWIVQIV